MAKHQGSPPPTRWPHWTPSKEEILGLLAANGLLWNTLSGTPWRRLPDYLELLAGSAIVSLVTTTLAGMETELAFFGFGAQLLLFISLSYGITPSIFPKTARNITERRDFRLLVMIISLLYFMLLLTFVFLPQIVLANTQIWFVAFISLLGLGAVIFRGYFEEQEQFGQLSDKDQLSLLNRFFSMSEGDKQETLEVLSYKDWKSSLLEIYIAYFLSILCTVFCLLFGLLAFAAYIAYPILEVTVIASVITVKAGQYSRLSPYTTTIERTVNIEERIYAATKYAGRSSKGFTSLLIISISLIEWTVIFYMFVYPNNISTTELFPATESTYSILDVSIVQWNKVGMSIGIFIAVIYGIWFWLRELSRLPSFLDEWEQKAGIKIEYSDEDSSEKSAESFLTRPIGYTAPAVLTVAVILIYIDPSRISRVMTSGFYMDLWYGIMWPLLTVVVGIGVWETLRTDPQPANTDSLALPISFSIQSFTLLYLLGISVVVSVLITSIFIILFYFDNIGISQGSEKIDSVANSVSLIFLGFLIISMNLFLPADYSPFLFVAAIVAIGGGCISILVRLSSHTDG